MSRNRIVDVPAKVPAWQVTDIGEPAEVLRRTVVEVPSPGPGEVTVAVETAALSFVDILLCQGKYQERPALPFTPGVEFFGRVAATGEGARLETGQAVIATPLVPGGGFCGLVNVDERLAYAVAEDTDPVKAPALIGSYITAVLALTRRAQLREGETILVHAGAGSVGSAAIQVARVLGARVFATAGGPEKTEVCRRLGAELAIDYTSDDFVAPVREATGGRGADVIFDPVGGDAFDRSLRCVALEGRILVIGFTSGRIPSVRVNHPLLKLYSVVGAAVGVYREAMPEVWQAGVARVLELFASGEIDPLVFRVLDFDEVPEGYRLLKDRATWGKIVTRVPNLASTGVS
jgi:NADPH2:quinone reductase